MLTSCHAGIAENESFASNNLLVGNEDEIGERVDVNFLNGNESVHILLLEVDNRS